MRTSAHGLHQGTRIHVTGAGKFGTGTISREPAPDAPYVTYRADYNLSERLAKITAVRRLDGPRL